MKDFGCSRIASKIDLECSDSPSLNQYIMKQITERIVKVFDEKIMDQIQIECSNRGIDIIDMNLFIQNHITICRYEPRIHINYVHLDYIDEENKGEVLFCFDTSMNIETNNTGFNFTIG